MKIRNLQEFVKDRCSNKDLKSLDLLYTEERNEEPFLTAILGDEGDVDNMVEKVASFAKDPEQQVFYEFVQNAFDANADTAYFYAGTVEGKDYLLVLNDGKPFYTDPKVKNKKEKREGQLFSFLNKGKSDKPNEPSIGEFGMGSKLLYTLLTDSSEDFSIASLMKPAIIDGRRAPYLLSWAEGSQLDNFLLDRNIWDRSCGYANTEFLIAKILCCYYPLEPGVSSVLFPDSEASILATVIKSLVNPEHLLHRFRQSGTAIVIPLGDGKLQTLTEERLTDKVGGCLAPFSSIIRGYKEFENKHLSRIFFLGKEIEEIHAVTVPVDIEKTILNETKKYRYQFVFDDSFLSPNTVNLYKALPISDSVYNLNFIIDSLDFPVDDSRQNISESNVAINGITKAMVKLVEQLDFIKQKDRVKFDRIYKCLLASRPTNDIVKVPFEEVLVPFLKNNILLVNGNYGTFESSVVISSELNIPISDLGITGVEAIDKNVVDDYTAVGIEFEELSLSDIIKNADKKKLSEWIAEITDDDYAVFHSEILSIIHDFSDVSLLRTNKGNIVTYDDVLDEKSNILFCDIAKNVFLHNDQLEYVAIPLGSAAPQEPEKCIWNKIKENASTFSSLESIDIICAILQAIEGVVSTKQIRENISLLKNINGNIMPFYDLFKKRPQNTILFEKFVAKAPLPHKVKDNWFVSDKQIWTWLQRHWETVKSLDDWNEYSSQYIKDIKYAWNCCEDKEKKQLELCLDGNGVPLKSSYNYIKGTLKAYSEEDYDELVKVFNDYEIVPYKYRMILTTSPFSLNGIGLEDLITDDSSALIVSSSQLIILIRLIDGFWNKYHVEKGGDTLTITKLSKGEQNYWCTIKLSEEEQKNLDDAGFKRIDNTISCPANEYRIDINSLLLEKAIEAVNSRILLFPIVKKCTGVIQSYCEYLEDIDFISSEDIAKDSIKWDLVKWFGKKEEYVDTIWSRITIDSQHLPENKLCPNKVEVKDSKTYSAYSLVPRLATEDAIVNKILNAVPEKIFFEENYCKKRRESISADDVIQEMDLDQLTVYQLEFALDCAAHGYHIDSDFKLAKGEDLDGALEMIFNRKFKHFYKKFMIDGFDPFKQIYASDELLLETEMIPESVSLWIKRHETEKVFDLFDDSELWRNHFLIQTRFAYARSGKVSIPGNLNDEERWLLENTFQWIIGQQNDMPISHSSNEYDIIKSLQILIKASDDTMPYLLKYTSSLSDNNDIQYKICLPDNRDVTFLALNSQEQRKKISQFLKEKNAELIHFFDQNDIYLPLEPKELMRKHLLANNKMLTLKYQSTRDNSWKEWNDTTYQRWLKMPESEQIHIYCANEPISSKIHFMDGRKSLIELPLQEGALYGYTFDEKGKLLEVAVTFPNGNDHNMYRALENNAVANIPEFQQPFIALQGLKLAELMDDDIKPEVMDALKKLNEDQLQQIIEGNFGNGDGSGDGKKQNDKSEDKEDEPKENRISGFIGELLYKKYLEKKGYFYNWDAQNGEGRYDFSIDNNSYVEIKTNVRTIKDGRAPFYLHRNQMEFLHQNQIEKYYVCRLSITDLGLYAHYKEIRERYGMDTDPNLNSSLLSECEKMVKDYWDKTTLQEFEELRWLYNIMDMYTNLSYQSDNQTSNMLDTEN